MNLDIVVTIDVDNDGVSTENERSNVTWRSLDVVPEIAQLLRSFEITATWFVRADNQIEDLYGDCGHLLAEYATLWEAYAASGDEIGWHPHIYRALDDGRYVPETDEVAFAGLLRRTHSALIAQGYRFSSVRIGEGVSSNAIVRMLFDLGLEVDATAIPGRARSDGERQFDWLPTPNHPYRPSASDYRVPGVDVLGTLLEIPITTGLFEAAYDDRPFLRYFNPGYHPAIFEAGLERYLGGLSGAAEPQVLAMVLHPDEAMMRSQQHGLYAHSLEAVRVNLTMLLDTCDRRGIAVRSRTLRDVRRTFFEREPAA